MKTYEVINPYIVCSIRDGKTRREYALRRGERVELPEEDVAVRAMVARRQIREVTEPEEPAGTPETNVES
ncbi:MAG TPA: hypothetical protein H9816_04145 [Candidatus Tidjanibacter faecipullorum]|uniref:Uncharacterized protein n=1 Tax=Candidatus Tidjanibacter faecipullorum TaxID=2838766 RepID=A0A9D2DDR2_9BACT|nr:hypothetical protein [Candidatus Tidjanibacter faecipullorum]